MGRGSRIGGSWTYLRIASGKVIEKVDQETPRAKSRVNKVGDTVYELIDDYVEGCITSLHHKDKEYEGEVYTSLYVGISDGNEQFSLELKKGSRYWSAIMMRLPNIDLTLPVRFAPYDFEDKEGNRVTGLNLFQAGEKVAPAWTKDEPGDLPQAVSGTFGGKTLWDFSARDEYLMVNVFDVTVQALGEIPEPVVEQEPIANEPMKMAARADQVVGSGGEDDLPF